MVRLPGLGGTAPPPSVDINAPLPDKRRLFQKIGTRKFLTLEGDVADMYATKRGWKEVGMDETVNLAELPDPFPPAKPKRRPADATLADDVMDPTRFDTQMAPHHMPFDIPKMRAHVSAAKKFVLDDAATVLLADLAFAKAPQVPPMIALAQPPEQLTWIEVPAKVLMDRRINQGTLKAAPVYRSQRARLAMLIEAENEGFVVWCFESSADSDDRYMVWPIGFYVRTDGQKIGALHEDEELGLFLQSHEGKRVRAGVRGKSTASGQARVLWGYDDTTDVSMLEARAIVVANPEFHAQFTLDDLKALANEMTGFPRLAVAALALLNAVPTVIVPARPEGTRTVREKGTLRSRPYQTHNRVTMDIPRRVRQRTEFARRAIQAEVHRKRWHQVDAHYRHVLEKPSTEGWEPCLHPVTLEPAFRKRIAAHGRGDRSLGEVIPKTVMVRGPRMNPGST